MALRIDCPEGLLQAARHRGLVGDAPDEEMEIVHDKTQAPVPVDGFELERLVFIELEKQARAKNVREKTVEALRARERAVDRGVFARPVLTPAMVKAEAIRSGERGPVFTVQLAAALAVLAAGAAAAVAIPGVVNMVRAASRGTSGGVGFRFDDAARIRLLLQGGAWRKYGQGGASQVGHDFSGTEG